MNEQDSRKSGIFDIKPTRKLKHSPDGELNDSAIETEPGKLQVVISHMGLPMVIDVRTSGYVEGDAGHGGFVEIRAESDNSDFNIRLFANDQEIGNNNEGLRSAGFRVEGGCEYEGLLLAMRKVVKFLEEHNYAGR